MKGKTEVKVSYEINTILHDLFNQIQYELAEQYEEEITQLTNNWNKLEEWLKNEYNEWSTVDDEIIRAEARQCLEVLDKMKEIKEGNNVSDRD